MEIDQEFVWLLLGVSIVTLIPRVLPMMLVSRFGLPAWLSRFLRYVPIAVMTALIVQSIVTRDEMFIPIQDNMNLIALIPTLIAAIWTRSLLITVITGICAMFLLQVW